MSTISYGMERIKNDVDLVFFARCLLLRSATRGGHMPKEYWAEPRARTKAKLDLLRNYLGAWFGILARATDEEGEHRYHELVYLDGFCGRGNYANGQDGSPLIAVKFANSVAARRQDLKIKIILVDQNNNSISHLSTLESIKHPHPNVSILSVQGSFEDTVLTIFENIDISRDSPTFSFGHLE